MYDPYYPDADDRLMENLENGCLRVGLRMIVLAVIIAVLIIFSCCSPKAGIYHYSAGKKHIISDEPIGPYHITDPLTTKPIKIQ